MVAGSGSTERGAEEDLVPSPRGDLLSSGPSPEAHSPLWMVSQEPSLNELVVYLQQAKDTLIDQQESRHTLTFSRSALRRARSAFDAMIRRGEEDLHRLCELFCGSFLGAYQLQSVVIGEVPSTLERFTLTQILSSKDLYSTIDLDLGNRQLRKLKYFDGNEWQMPSLVANMVEYQPTEPNKLGIHKIISRIKAEEELWNKVVDELFGLDTLVKQDKELKHLSRYVKDVFGVKVVVGSVQEVIRLHETLTAQEWGSDELSAVRVLSESSSTKLSFLEVKDYLRGHEKGSGWEAIKSVVQWRGKTFEIQIQPLRNFWREREVLTQESHVGFKSRREEVRNQVADQVPLFRFFRNLLKWLVQNPDSAAPERAGVEIKLID